MRFLKKRPKYPLFWIWMLFILTFFLTVFAWSFAYIIDNPVTLKAQDDYGFIREGRGRDRKPIPNQVSYKLSMEQVAGDVVRVNLMLSEGAIMDEEISDNRRFGIEVHYAMGKILIEQRSQNKDCDTVYKLNVYNAQTGQIEQSLDYGNSLKKSGYEADDFVLTGTYQSDGRDYLIFKGESPSDELIALDLATREVDAKQQPSSYQDFAYSYSSSDVKDLLDKTNHGYDRDNFRSRRIYHRMSYEGEEKKYQIDFIPNSIDTKEKYVNLMS